MLSTKRKVVRRVLLASAPVATMALLQVGCAAADGQRGIETETRAEPVVANAGDLRELALKHTGSLKNVKLPDSSSLNRFIKNRDAAIRLGKALFWDQQVGSDGQACASCHFHAGADNRSKNQLNPGFRNEIPGINPNAFNDPTGFGPNKNNFRPNYQLTPDDFPFRKLYDPDDRNSKVISDTNEVLSSQGVFNAVFVRTGIPNDVGIPSLAGNGAVFNVNGVLVRNVEPRSTPTVINAAFNHRNFWDGRARFEFNGVSPIGKLDPGVRVVERVGWGFPALVSISIPRSSLASQAVGPVVSDLEVAFGGSANFLGRRFQDTGRKMLDPALVPLGQQLVPDDDSVLGSVSAAPELGLDKNFSYRKMVQAAFEERWWNVPGFIVDISGRKPVLKKQAVPQGKNQFTVMEYNFSLFFGLAVQEYEKTLISDDTPFDRFMDGKDDALTATEQEGLQVFLDKGKCVNCHGGPEFTNASLRNVQGNQIIERMVMGDNRVAVYDNGFYNIGVRPTREDIGVGGRIGPRNLPLSNSRLYQEELRELVWLIRAFTPFISNDKAIRLANKVLGIPRIEARPDEAEKLLKHAAPAAEAELQAAADALAAIIATLPGPVAGDTVPCLRIEATAKLAEIQALLDAAMAAVESGSANDAAPMLLDAATKLDALAKRLNACVDAQTDKAREHLEPAVSLLPDPIDPGHDPDHPLGPPLRPDERVAVDGAFKTPTLRNVSETAPFFHNGGQATLEQVIAFYNRGGDFANVNRQDLDPDIQPLGLSPNERAALAAFLRALTDDRVRFDKKPFDHPSLSFPNGGTTPAIGPIFPNTPVLEDRVTLPAVGKDGSGVRLGTPNTPFAHFLQPLQ
jgi:cytochrome c peroxidase